MRFYTKEDKLINTGHGQIVDADLGSYFDSVPHAELMRSVARRVVDGAMLHLIATSVGTDVGVRAIGTKVEVLRKGLRSVLCSAICTCDGSCWGGRNSGTRSVGKRT